MNFLNRFFGIATVNLDTLAAGLLVEAYNRPGVYGESEIEQFARVRYLELCTNYGLPMAFTQEVQARVIAQYRPDTFPVEVLFE